MLSNYHLNEIKTAENFNDYGELKKRISFILNYNENLVLDFEKIDSIDYFLFNIHLLIIPKEIKFILLQEEVIKCLMTRIYTQFR